MGVEDKTWLEKHVRTSSKEHKGIKTEDRLTFLQQLSILLNAGTPLLDSLRLCAQQSLSLRLRGIINQIASQVASGTPFHKACGSHDKVFPMHWIQIIQVAEMTGEMASVLGQLCQQAQKAEKTRSKLVSAMVYPAVMVSVAILCVVVMLWKVVPTFAQFFADFGAKLPGITQGVLNLSNFIRAKGLYVVFAIAALVFLFRRWVSQESGRRTFNQITMAMPVVGELVVNASMEKFSSNLALLLRSGTPLLQALQTLRGVMQSNMLYAGAILFMERRVSSGGALAASIEETSLFPSMVVGMVRVGEDAGQLPEVLDQVAHYYDAKVEVAVQRFMSMVEPLVIIGMGVTVGVIMAAIYMPMFQLSAAVK